MEILKEVGLTDRESRVYLALLELGQSTTGPIIKKSGIPNSKIYEVLESLQNKGLVSWIIKGKIKYFKAADPKKILTILKEKERKLQEVIPLLKEKQRKSLDKSSVELFEGLKSIKNMFLNITQNNKDYWYGFGPGIYSENIRKFYDWWGFRRKERTSKGHLLISLENKKCFEKQYKEYMKIGLRSILKYSKVSFPNDVFLYRNYVVLLNWEEIPSAILIKSRNLFSQYLNFFKNLWKQAEK